MTATAARRYSRWDLDTLRAGKAVRDEIGEPIPVLDAMLAEAEAQFAQGTHSREVEPARVQTGAEWRAADGRRTGTRANGATDKQRAFIARLCDELGRDADDRPVPADSREASRMIDALKAQVARARRAGTATRPERKATERQVEFLADLLNERAHDLGEIDPAALAFERASALITELLDAPRAKVAAHGIREGRYAYTPDDGTTADHYRVRRDGKIVVWTAGGEWPYNGALNEGLQWIKANPREAAELFGRLTETCGRCGRDLSDDDSRARGLGPVCATKTEW
jgi:hypothetical protein